MVNQSITISLEPEKEGQLLYLPGVIDNGDNNMSSLFSFRIEVQNRRNCKILLNHIHVSFPETPVISPAVFNIHVNINGRQKKRIYMTPNEGIVFDARYTPLIVNIDHYFDHLRLPIRLCRRLKSYSSPITLTNHRRLKKKDDMDAGQLWMYAYLLKATFCT